MSCRDEREAGRRDFQFDRHPSYERSRYEHEDRCYFGGYDAAKRQHEERLEEERWQEEQERRAYEQARSAAEDEDEEQP